MDTTIPPIQPPQPPTSQTNMNVGWIAVGVAVVLFFIGLFLYISSSGEVRIQTSRTPQTTPQPNAIAQNTNSNQKASRVEGQVILKFKDGVSTAQINERLRPLNASVKSTVAGIGTTVISVPPGTEDAVLKELANDPLVQYAESDYIYTLQFSPNDPMLSSQWAIRNTGQVINNKAGLMGADIKAESAWDVSRGTGAKIAILDSGIDLTHPELASKVVANRSFTTPTIADLNGHGTHVAGIIAADANNGQGVAGVCPDCQLVVGKITNDDLAGSVPSSVIAPAIIWAADNNVQVLNLSIAGPNFSQAVQDAVMYAWNRNIVVVAAAGNNATLEKRYPAAYQNVVSVANSDSDDAKSPTSNFGDWVQLTAPGDTILSTFPTTQNLRNVNNYGYLTGTSMASPVVAGVAGLVWKTQFGTSNAAVVQQLYASADKIAGTGAFWRNGRVNAARAVGIASNLSVSITPSPTSIIPVFVCGGSTDSICQPTTPPGTPTPTPIGYVAPSVNPTTGQPVPSPTPVYGTPCVVTSVASKSGTYGKAKHKKAQQGAVHNSSDAILRILITLLNLLLSLFGGGGNTIPVPGNTQYPPCPPGTQ